MSDTMCEALEKWAKAEGFEAWAADHAAVLRNLAKWLDRELAARKEAALTLDAVRYYCDYRKAYSSQCKHVLAIIDEAKPPKERRSEAIGELVAGAYLDDGTVTATLRFNEHPETGIAIGKKYAMRRVEIEARP